MRGSIYRTRIGPKGRAAAAGLLLAGLLAHPVPGLAAESFSQQVVADPHGAVEISNVAGRVDVEGWDKPQVDVRATLGSSSMRVDVQSGNGRISIRVNHGAGGPFGGGPWFGGGEARLTVHVPKDSEVDVTVVSADVRSTGVKGAQRLHSVSGNVEADFGSADVEVNSVSGNIRVAGDETSRSVRVGSVSGDVDVERAAGDIEAQSVSGELKLSAGAVRSVRVHTTSGDVSFRGRLVQGGTLEGETISGELHLEAGAEAGYNYDVTTFSGDIENCFGQKVVRSQYGPGRRLSGTRGEGSARVRVKSMSGDVSLCER